MFSHSHHSPPTNYKINQLNNVNLVTILESSPNSIYVIDVETLKIEYANPTARQQLGYSLEEFQEMTPSDFNEEFTNKQQLKELGSPLIQGEVTQLNFETTHRHRNGTLLPVELYIQLINQGNQSKFFTIAVDISQRKTIENSLQTKVTQLETITNHIPGIIYQCYHFRDGAIKINYVNGRVEEILGISVDTLYADFSYFLNLIHPDDRPNLIETIQHTIPNLYPFFWEGRLITPSHQIIWIQIQSRSQPQLRSDGIIVTNGVLLDITEKRKDKQEISHYRQLRNVIFNEATDALFLIDPDTLRILDCNKSAVQLLNANSKDDLLSQKSDFLGPKLLSEIEKVSQTQVFRNQQYQLKTIDGKPFWADMAWQTIQVTESNYYLIRMTDITAKKHFEEELKVTNERLEATNQELEQATRLKDEILANMSHELRTPLNAIIGLSEAFAEETFSQISDRQKRTINSIRTSANHLLSLINDILDLAKTQTGKVSLEFSQTNIRSLCESSLTFICQKAYQKQIELTTHIDTYCDALNIDELRIRQVLINLLTNAIRFTPKGGKVTLTVKEDQTREHIIFSVTDTGIGIPRDQIQQIFEPFKQLENQLNRQYSGTGLGLPLVRRLTELHGGSVMVESELGQGTTFYVQLPYSDVCWISSDSNEVVPQFHSESIKTLSTSPLILLVSSDEVDLENHRNYLEACGYQIISVTQIQELASILDEFNPQLIVVDLEAFNLEPETIVENIQQHTSLQEIPIIAFTATDTHDRLYELGIKCRLTKPVRLRHLRSEIQKLLPEEFQR